MAWYGSMSFQLFYPGEDAKFHTIIIYQYKYNNNNICDRALFWSGPPGGGNKILGVIHINVYRSLGCCMCAYDIQIYIYVPGLLNVPRDPNFVTTGRPPQKYITPPLKPPGPDLPPRRLYYYTYLYLTVWNCKLYRDIVIVLYYYSIIISSTSPSKTDNYSLL